MQKLTVREKQIHDNGLKMSRTYHGIERDLIGHLAEVERTQLLMKLDRPSLFAYLTQELRFSEAVAQSAITVYRKSKMVPAISKAVQNKEISLSRASRIVSVIAKDNADDLIAFAKTHTKREIDHEVARINPKAARKDREKVINEDLVELNLTLSKQQLKQLERAKEIIAQSGSNPSSSDAVVRALELFLFHKDPVEKATRSEARKHKQQEASVKDAVSNKEQTIKKITIRQPLRAERKHEVMSRDGGQCTHVDLKGERCCERRFIDIHQFRPVSQGGGNELENLTTLCGFHHDMAHQLAFPIDGQVTWFR